MKKFSFTTLLISMALCFSLNALALMPPMTEEELKEESNTIVKGKITKVECTGKFKETKCVKRTGYKANLKVNQTVMGKKQEDLILLFDKYEFKKGCVGSPDTTHHEGEEGLYYLQCTKDQCYLTHWNGIEYFEKSKKPLPKCKK